MSMFSNMKITEHSFSEEYSTPLLLPYHLELASLLLGKFKKIESDGFDDEKFKAAYDKLNLIFSLHCSSFFISPHHPMRTLAEFSTLEALLSHKPKTGVNTDSISHQIGTKLALLANRYDKDFPSVQGQSIKSTWKKLYNYRSEIAHGSVGQNPIERDGQIVVNCLSTDDFVAATVRAVIRAYILEPQLIYDLAQV